MTGAAAGNVALTGASMNSIDIFIGPVANFT
jgi:hypothetical protein